jgi:hypothetical protein
MRSLGSRGFLALVVALVAMAGAGAPASANPAAPGSAQTMPVAHSATASTTTKPQCSAGLSKCAEVYNSEDVFGPGKYVGHDEPAVLFYSNQAGAGNHNRWQLTIPKDPPHDVVPGRTWNFQLHPAFWFGMALCDTQSYPLVTSTCTPDSDTNIKPLASHAGTAFMELQFYPPGWVKQFDSQSCDVTRWCAALNIDSLSRDPLNGLDLNRTCQSQILGGIEPINFAYISKNGVPNDAPNPLDFNPLTSGRPNANDLFMNPGDLVQIDMRDTGEGLRIDLRDRTTHDSGFMVASARNNFGQIKFAPTGTSCTTIPYNFHPMYSTSSEQTRVPWTAHSFNIAMSDEIGHWDYCSAPAADGTCPTTAMEGDPHANANTVNDQEAADGDDNACFNPPPVPFVQVSGCNGQNDGFDGVNYHLSWPDGNTNLHPTPITFSSPLTGGELNRDYQRMAFEADLPRVEGNTCNVLTGVGCTLTPSTDERVAADFYPFFSTSVSHETCRWMLGNFIPGVTTSDWGGGAQWGHLLPLEFLVRGGHGATATFFDDFRQVIPVNPCRNGEQG